MPLTRLDNLISSKSGRYLYVSPDDFNASDELDNRGNSPTRPFKTIQRAFIEVSRYSYLPGIDNDRFDEFTIMLMPGDHYIDNRPGLASTSGTPVFGFDQSTSTWTDSSVLDLSNPDNVLYKFNGTDGGCVVPRGCSLIGYDLRRTHIRPLYVPDPADKEQGRTSIFNVTGGAYIWQFTIKDGDITSKSPLYDNNNAVGKVYYRKNDNANLAIPEYSHHKITVFQYAEKTELELYYSKIADAFSQYQPTIDDVNEFGQNVSENRIVGPLSDLRSIESIQVVDSSPVGNVTVNVTTKVAHGYIKDQFFAVQSNGLDDALNGTFSVSAIDSSNRRKFSFELPGTVASLGLQNNQTYGTGNGLSANAYVQAEVDSVESASPYMFNLSIRSTWGICGLLADGSKASGFKSMVCAQYTGVSLQKDDRAFIRYDKFTNTWNQASLSDAFATVPYHTKGDAYWKDDWRNCHIKAINDSFIQCVSIFAVGFADHFLMESGGDMSITNSNSNFGNTSLHAKGFKGYSFAQDKGGYIDAIIPPKKLNESAANEEQVNYYTWDVQASRNAASPTKLYYAGTGVTDPKQRPAATLNGFRIGAKSKEKIFVELDPYGTGTGKTTPTNAIFNATLEPSGFTTFPTSLQILNPTTVVVDNKNQDAANLIEANKDLIAEEAYGYITTKYPALLQKNIIITKCQRDIGLILDAVISDLRLGGNINTIQAAEAYFSAGELNYIDGEKFETLEGYEYARDLAIASFRNWDYLQVGCSVSNGSALVTVPSTVGLAIGMKVEEYTTVNANNTTVDPSSLTTTNIPTDTYIRNIVNATTVELGAVVAGQRSYLSTGTTRNATGTNASAKLVFKLEDQNGDRKGVWSSETGNVDTTITTDTVYPECATTSAAVVTYFDNIKTIINQGINPVGDRFADAYDLLIANKNYIADVAVKDMKIEYPSHIVPGGDVNCFDDIVDIVEAVAYNVKFGANNKVWDAANLYVTGAHLDGEEEESIYAFRIAKAIAKDVVQNVTYTPRAGVNTSYTQVSDGSITTDPNPVSGVYCADVVSSVDSLFQLVEYGIDTAGSQQQQLGTFTPSDAAYNPATGDLTLTMSNHGLNAANKVSIATGALRFTCGMDANATNHDYPRVGDPAYKNSLLSITDLTTDTVKVNVGATPLVGYNVADATYTASSGVLELALGNHTLNSGTNLKIDNNSLNFKCSMDHYGSIHSYPRPSDPFFNTSVEVASVGSTEHTITGADYNPTTGDLTLSLATHGFKARTTKTASNAIYDPTTGEMVITSNSHGFLVGDSVIIADNSLTFTCAKDSDATTHSYPRPTDPASGASLVITAKDQNTFTVNVGTSSNISAHTFDSAGTNGIIFVGDRVQLVDNSLTFTCAKDNNATQHNYPRPTDDASGEWLEITAKPNDDQFTINIGQSPDTSAHTYVTAAANGLKKQTGTITVNIGQSPIVSHNVTAATYNALTGDMQLTIGTHSLASESKKTPTNAAYNPTTGVMTITSDSHGFLEGDRVKIDAEAFTFTCAQDSNATQHKYPRTSDPVSSKFVEISNVTNDTFDVQVLAQAPSTNTTAHTFVSATSNSITKKGESIQIAANSLSFTCTMDGNTATKTYPRTSDPYYNRAIPIKAADANTITVNVGQSPIVGFDVSSAVYNPTSGDMQLTIGDHTLDIGDGIRLAEESLIFTCLEDSNGTEHKYPRAGDPVANTSTPITAVGTSSHTVTTAGYNPVTGIMTLTIPGHNFANGNRIKIADNSLTFTCAKDDHNTTHTYPRATDYASGTWLEISNVQTDTFDVQVLPAQPSTNITAHTFTAASASGVTRQTGVVTINVLASAPSTNTTTHTFVPATDLTPTNGAYNPTTGIVTITSVNHGMKDDDHVKLADGALKFSCTYGAGNHIYTGGTATNAVTITAGSVQKDVTDASYTPSTGVLQLTIGSHSFTTSDTLTVAAGALDFTCDLDSHGTTHSYPRATDPSYNTALAITAVDATTVTVNVGVSSPGTSYPRATDPASGKWLKIANVTADTFDVQILDVIPSTNTTSHTFVSGVANSIKRAVVNTGGDYVHSFVSATAGAVKSGGDYTHLFDSAKSFAIKTGGDYPHTFVTAGANSVTGYSTNAGQFVATTKTSPSQNVVSRANPSVSSDQFAQRGTLFTVDAGGTNPHKFESGTPVRLVARAKAGAVGLDERDVRLPQGFQPNRTYYVIAPGRNTQPFNYNDANVYNGIFDGRDQTKLMLANTKENAAAGIYIYSSETESLADDVEIIIEQYVLDSTYDLHEYRCTFNGTSGTILKTDVAHIFDKPSSAFNATEIQKVFFRTAGSDGNVGTLPTIAGGGGAQVSSTVEYYVRYESEDTFKIFATAQNAIVGSPEVQLDNNPTQFWYVFANKRTSPMRFDPTFVDTSASRQPAIPDGLWYLNLKDESTNDDNIVGRLLQTDYDSASGQTQTTDSYYTRLKDERKANDRIYRLRYVQPSTYPGSIRKPNNGFVMKVRTDDKRNLLPQNITLEPVGGSPTKAEFRNPQTQNASEVLGMTKTAFDAAVQAGTVQEKYIYDPDNNPCVVNTDNFLRFSIRSAREVTVGSQQLLQLTAFDHRVDDTNAPSLKNTVFHTVEISSPQAGSFSTSKTSSTPSNIVQWTGGSSGFGYIHAYFAVGTKHYIILKDVSARPTYDALTNTRFQQGAVYADQQKDVNNGRDSKTNNLYVVGGANLFTLTPGDTMNDSIGNSYRVVAVEDIPQIEDTFYIFDSETIQDRVADQQDGIYYLTAVRGNVSPLPRGAGVGNNFQNFKFSQPISSLYPIDYKNDPTWYQVVDNNGTKDTLVTDPPASSSFADNYTHGLVWVNDAKRSMTKESITDLTETGYFKDFNYTGSNALKAQNGNATSGSEQRKIAIAGDATSIHDQKVYIELRRPSIARSGNHTFEYLGFGPGNYSTGLPVRQEVILSEFQDYYAQAKREDGGIVFYTGLNSNGDLYIGNRKIDAITGEETFLEKAQLVSSTDDTDTITTLVTSFDTPVTFKDKITVEGVSYFNNRVIISTQPPTESPALTILSNPRTDGGAEDITLTRGSWADRNKGDIYISRNKISTAIYHIKGRGTTIFPGQEYSIRSNFSYTENLPSNRTPDQGSTFSANQVVKYYVSSDVDANPQAGDILYKGKSIEKSGSLGWIYANYYTNIPETSILDATTNGTSTVKINWSGVLTNASAGINMVVGKTIRIQGFSNPQINGKWVVTKADQSGADNGYIEFVVANTITTATYNWTPSAEPTATLERSDENWKETGVIGAEAIRTDTEAIGQYKVGINTVARTTHDAHEHAFLSYIASGTSYDQQVPRANLDVVGNAFISGKTIGAYLSDPTVSKTETNLHEAFLVGGASDSPSSNATFRVSTQETRVGINTSRSELGDTLTVKGTLRLLGASANADIDGDLNVDGGDITTNATSFNLLNSNATTLNVGGDVENAFLFNTTANAQQIEIGTNVTQAAALRIHTSTTDSTINIGTVADTTTNKSVITIGGAFSNTANSTLTVKNAQTILDGDLEVNGGDLQSNASTINLFTRAGAGSIVNFATRASQFLIGGVAGTTEIRNSLKVNGDTDMYGDITMHGGSNSGTVTVNRARLLTSALAHSAGALSNLNVDFYKYVSDIDGAQIITSVNAADGTLSVPDNYFLDGNQVRFSDTSGLSNNVDTTTTYYVVDSNKAAGTFRVSTTEASANAIVISGTPGTSTGITLQNHTVDTGSGTTDWTGNSGDAAYNQLPINNIEGVEIGDILIIGTELVEVVSPGPDINTRLITVNRGVDCTTVAAHADNEVIWKLAKSGGATYLTGRVPINSTTPAISSVNDITDTLEVPINELASGDAVQFSNAGSIVGVSLAPVTYFVVNAVNDSGNNVTRFQLSLDPNGTAIALSGNPTGSVLNFSSTLLSLAEFGGQFSINDYLRLSASSTCPSGEFVQITAVNDTNAEKFRVHNGANQDRFVIDSVYGGVSSTILSTQKYDINLTSDASTNSTDNQFRILNGQPIPATRLTIDSDGKFTVVGNGTESLPKAIINKDGQTWLAGNLRVQNDGNAGSNDDAKSAFYVNSVTGDVEASGHLQVDDDFTIFSGTTGVQFPTTDEGRFHVDAQTGDTRIGLAPGTTGAALGDGDLTVNGGHVNIVSHDTATPSATDYALNIINIGVSSNRKFQVRQDAAVNAFGQDRFWGKNGGLKWEFLSSDATCVTGRNYMIAITATSVFTLPTEAETGDMIRFIEVTGALTYSASLVVRAPSGVGIQGDATGTSIANGNGAGGPYGGGELIVQTRNAGFGLVYAGTTDGAGNTIPSTYRGWWLVEI